jgi:hypothetical protein
LPKSLGKPPSTRIYRKHGDYTVKTFCKRFGGWNPALRAAGFEPNVEINLSNQTLIAALREFAEELGQPPTIEEMEQRGPYTAGPYKRAFGSWNRALQEAGLEVHQARDVDNCVLISELKRLAEELGHVPQRDEMRDQGNWSATVYQERFGSWNSAPQAAGFDQNQRWRIPREKLLAELRAVAEELGHSPTTTEMNKYGTFTSDPYQRVFGGWRTALQAADSDYLEDYCQSDTETVPFGSNWPPMREKIIARDNESCLRCGMECETHRDQFGHDLPVHHRIPRQRFYNDPDLLVEESNIPSNLLTLCIPCHRCLERVPVQPIVD